MGIATPPAGGTGNCFGLQEPIEVSMRRHPTLAPIVFLLLAAAPAVHGAQSFTQIGPGGGSVSVLATDPTNASILYAGADQGGLFKSTDGGATWSAIGAGTLQTKYVQVLAVDPSKPTTVYAGAQLTAAGQPGPVFKSTDGGASWVASSSGLPSVNATSLAIDPSSPSRLFLGYGGGVARTTDGGASWQLINQGIPTGSSYVVAVQPGAPYMLLAANDNTQLFFSTDQGTTWQNGSAGLTGSVAAIAFSPINSTNVYLAADDGFYVFKIGPTAAVVGGRVPLSNWLLKLVKTVRLFRYLRALFAKVVPPGTTEELITANFNSYYKSLDEGDNWDQLPDPPPGQGQDIKDPAGTYFAGTLFNGVWKTTDSGTTWTEANVGLDAATVTALAPAGSTLYAGTQGGVSKSTDGGATWATAISGLKDSSNHAEMVHALVVDPTNASTVYAATDDGVFKSTDGAATWKKSTTGASLVAVSYLAIDPSTPATLYAIANSTNGPAVYRTKDGAATWTNVGSFPSQAAGLAVDPRVPSRIFTTANGAFQRSTDGGTTWTAGTNDHFFGFGWTFAFPLTGTNVFAGTDQGVFLSTDAGATWKFQAGLQPPTFLSPDVRSIAIDPHVPTTIYAASSGSGLFRSTDGGATWAGFGPGLTTQSLQTLAFDATGALLVGTAGSSVFRLAQTGGTTALLPSSARAAGAGGAFYTTDLTVANTGSSDTTFVLKFLGNNADGRGGAQATFPLGAGKSTTFTDVLGSVFGRTSDYGAILVTSPSDSVRVLAQTSTPGFGGTFGQSVPAARPQDLIVGGTPRSILAVREDAAFRTNLILANATQDLLEVDVALFSDSGTMLGAASYTLPPLGMTQVSRVVRALGVSGDVVGARLVLSTPVLGNGFGAYAAAIDNTTNDPRTLLPLGPITSDHVNPDVWILPSSAHSSGSGGAFYTTDLTVGYTNNSSARFTLQFLGNNMDGRSGAQKTFDLAAERSVTYVDVLGSVFQQTFNYGGILLTSQYPSSDTTFISVLAQTSTPGFGGTFGQSVPAATAADLVRNGQPQSILAIREDGAFRTNLILTSATGAGLEVDVMLVSADGVTLGSKSYALPPLGMTQVSHVVRDLGVATDVAGARLVLSTPTASGAFAAYASAIDNVTNDPRTLLPR
jgi:hypothetical protein